MNIIDIILGVILAYSLYRGFKNGLIVELCGILGILLGVYLSYKFGNVFVKYIDLSYEVASVLSFIAVFVIAVVVVHLLARLVSKLLSGIGLGGVNRLLGGFASLIKFAIVLSLLLSLFTTINRETKWVEKKTMDGSVVAKYLNKSSELLFPYIDFIKDYYQDFKESEKEG